MESYCALFLVTNRYINLIITMQPDQKIPPAPDILPAEKWSSSTTKMPSDLPSRLIWSYNCGSFLKWGQTKHFFAWRSSSHNTLWHRNDLSEPHKLLNHPNFSISLVPALPGCICSCMILPNFIKLFVQWDHSSSDGKIE